MPSPGVLLPAFPPPLSTNVKPVRFYATGTATADYADNQFSFERVDPKNPLEPEQAWSSSIRIRATSGNITFSFDGVTDHGFVPLSDMHVYWDRYEGGIAIKGSGTFHVEAW